MFKRVLGSIFVTLITIFPVYSTPGNVVTLDKNEIEKFHGLGFSKGGTFHTKPAGFFSKGGGFFVIPIHHNEQVLLLLQEFSTERLSPMQKFFFRATFAQSKFIVFLQHCCGYS